MAVSRLGQLPFLLGTLLILTACEEGGSGSGNDETRIPQAGGVRVTAADIEAPQDFAVNENALWDGRPSLGGVWVAHPDVDDPARVAVTNPENGRTIVAALFRRERANPGPRTQVSSDAAEELGMLAGQPVRLRVVALRRAEPAAPPMPIADNMVDPEAPAEAAAPDAEAAEIAASATAAIEAADGAPSEDGAEAAAAVEAQPVPEERSPSSFGRRTPRAQDGEAQPVPEDAPPTSFGRRSRQATTAATEAATATGAAAADVTVAPLDGAAAPAEAAPATAAAAPAGTGNSFIQAAIFTGEANANKAAGELRAAGLPVNVRQTTSNGRTLYRVVVGPGANAEMLAKVRAAGYRDAYPVRG